MVPPCLSAARGLAALTFVSSAALADPQLVVGHVELVGIVRGEGLGGESSDVGFMRRVLRNRLASMRGCYEHALRVQPGLAGDAEVDITVRSNGLVSDVDAPAWRQASPVLAACVVPYIGSLVFPASDYDGNVGMVARFRFTRLR
ncbi:MAG: AgmX/PglI C-terminal domain-containing protein [Deltaproteobacteria bacterium]